MLEATGAIAQIFLEERRAEHIALAAFAHLKATMSKTKTENGKQEVFTDVLSHLPIILSSTAYSQDKPRSSPRDPSLHPANEILKSSQLP